MASLIIKFADLASEPIGSGNDVTAEILVSYTREVPLTNGTVLQPVPMRKQLGPGGTAIFEVTPADDPTVVEAHRDFGLRVEWLMTHRAGRGMQKETRGARTVKVTVADGTTVQFGSLLPIEPLPAQYTSVADYAAELTQVAEGAAADAGQALTEAQAARADANVLVDDYGNLVTLAQEAQAAALEVPDANMAAAISNPATESRQALEATFREGAVRFAVNYATLQEALDDMPTSGGVLQLEAGDYETSERAVAKAGTLLRGANGPLRSGSPGGTATRILYTGAEGPALTSDGSRWGAENLTVAYNNPNFTGTVVEGGATLGTPNIYRSHVIFRNVWIGSLVGGTEASPVGGYPAESCVDLHGAQNIFFDNCHFFGAQYNISGVRSGVTEWAHAIAVNFRNCTFHRHDQWAVRNPHFSWSFDNCSFERNESHVGQALIVEVGLLNNPVGCHFNNCWFGDNDQPGNWIEWRGSGLVLTAGRAVNVGSMVKLLSGNVTLVGVTATPLGAGTALVDATVAGAGSAVTILGGQPGATGTMLKGDVYPTSYFVQGATPFARVNRLDSGGGSFNAPGLGFGQGGGMTYNPTQGRLALVQNGDEHIRMTAATSMFLQSSRFYGNVGFYGSAPVARPTLPSAATVTAADIRAALITLGLAQ